MRNIYKLRAILTKLDLEIIIHAFIFLDFCNSLFICFNKSAVTHLQDAAARLKEGHIAPVLSTFHWLRVKFRIDFKIFVLDFRAVKGQAT